MDSEIKLDSLSLEQCVIGCMISTPQNFSDGCDTLTEEHFKSTKEKLIFRILLEIYNKTKPEFVDSTIIMSYFEQLKIECQGLDKDYIDYIVDCSNLFKYNEYKQQLCNILSKDKFVTLLKQYALNLNSVNIHEGINKFIKIASNIQCANRYNCHTVKEVVEGTHKNTKSRFEKLQDAFKNKDTCINIPGVYKTGFTAIDDILGGGLKTSNIIIIAARPAMAKTAFALNIALNLTKNKAQRCSIGILSFEMSSEQLLDRMLSMSSFVSTKDMQNGSFNKDALTRMQNILEDIKDLEIVIEDNFSSSFASMTQTIEYMKRVHGINVLIIDYLQLIKSDDKGKRNDTRNLELSEISRYLKLTAVRLDIAIVCISQLSRKVEDRPDKKPRMSDIRDSGSIEQDADQILLMYRPSYYDGSQLDIEQVFISVAKNRHGETGTSVLSFERKFMKFKNINGSINI